DGSTDGTNAILRAVSEAEILCTFLPTRGGKSNALNHAVAQAHHDILIFSDAATLFAPDAIEKLVRHFSDPRVGVVCGALQFAASSVAGEFTRRVRLATGSFQALAHVIRTPLDPITTFAFISHKVLRWILPFLLIAMLVSSGLLWSEPLYRIAFLGQLAFYFWA